jgi:hypothetical protein
MPSAEQIIHDLGLQPHPEGGYFRETYRSGESIELNALPPRYSGSKRALGTAIYFLLTADTFSCLHRLKTDEVYHFYLGEPVEMLLLRNDGDHRKVKLGSNLAAAEVPQIVVPQGWWQGSRVIAGGAYALLGCTMAPGFDFADYEEGERLSLQKAYPQVSDEIASLTRK